LILRERKVVKTLALIEGPQILIVARTPPAVSGTSIRISLFIWATGLLPEFFTLNTYTGVLLRRSPEGTTLSTWAVERALPIDATLSGLDTSRGTPEEVNLEAASIKAAGTGAVLVNLAVGLSVPRGFFGVAE
jgi:hypothetical protein